MAPIAPARALLRAGNLLSKAAQTNMPHPRTAAAAGASAARQYHRTPALLYAPYKDDQDRQSLKPRSTEGTKSGTDQSAAAHDDAAFNPNKTSPEEERETAAEKTGGSPLEVSGANQDISKPQGDEPGKGKGAPEDKKRSSGGGSAPKYGKGP